MLSIVITILVVIFGLLFAVWALKEIIGIQYISNDRVGVVEKLWGGSIAEGHIIAMNREAGFQCDVKRGGLHFGLPRWKFRIHRIPLVTIPQGKMGYIYARDGDAMTPSQTLGRTIQCNNFQDGRAFLGETYAEDGTILHAAEKGQRGRQRTILREGVYAINLALFVVVAEDRVYTLRNNRDEEAQVTGWQKELSQVQGFSPIIIGRDTDNIGVVSVQDGPALKTDEIIAPEIQGHNNFQDPETFLANGGQRGKQIAVLTDGTYWINRWFANVESIPKTVVPIGSVGVVISYYGKKGTDISGDKFRHGERVTRGERGVWSEPLSPGKYAFNTYAGQVVFVPTTNFVLHWIDGKSESHRYDDTLKSIDLVTKDAYEPLLPLSLVVHIDYEKAPGVVQRFGDVKKLITQTIDPMLSAYFRDCAQGESMLDLLQHREEIQREARKSLALRFAEFDIECVDVLVGKPETGPNDGQIEKLLEQLRQRQLSREQVETFGQQRAAAEEQKKLTEAQAIANKQRELTDSSIQIKIAENAGNAELAKAQMRKQQTIVEAEATLEQSRRVAETMVINAKALAEQTLLGAEADSKKQILIGKGESTKILQIGISEAESLRRKVSAYSDPRLYAMVLTADAISKSAQPLVPERVFLQGQSDESSPGNNVLTTMLNLFLANNTAFANTVKSESAASQEITDLVVNQAVNALDAGDVSKVEVTKVGQ